MSVVNKMKSLLEASYWDRRNAYMKYRGILGADGKSKYGTSSASSQPALKDRPAGDRCPNGTHYNDETGKCEPFPASLKNMRHRSLDPKEPAKQRAQLHTILGTELSMRGFKHLGMRHHRAALRQNKKAAKDNK